MSHNLREFVEAVYAFDATVRRVDADRWSSPSPCEGWDARAIVGHQCAVLNGVEAVASSGAMAAPIAPDDVDDPVAVWEDTRDRLLTTLDQGGVLQQQGPFWFRAPTVDDLIGIVKWDLVTHTWDLAQATGQSTHLRDGLVEATYAVVEPMADMLVESGRTAASVEVAADAPILERFLGLVGRSPA